ATAAEHHAPRTAAHASATGRTGTTSASGHRRIVGSHETGNGGGGASSTPGRAPSTDPGRTGSTNQAPVAADDHLTVAEDSGPTSVSVLGNARDPGNDPLTVVTATTPSHGHVSFGAVAVTYTPTANFNGADHF